MNKAPLIQQRIPVTSPALYLSGIQALNLHENGIDDPTGDWHFVTAFFTYADQPQDVPLYGAGGTRIDTHESLGARGIRDLSAIVRKQELVAPEGPVSGERGSALPHRDLATKIPRPPASQSRRS